MPKRLGDLIPQLPVRLDVLDMRSAGDERRVEHGRSLPVILVVRDHAFGRVVRLAVRVDRRALRTDNEGQRLRSLNSSLHAVEGDLVVSVTNNDCDPAAGDTGLGRELKL